MNVSYEQSFFDEDNTEDKTDLSQMFPMEARRSFTLWPAREEGNLCTFPFSYP